MNDERKKWLDGLKVGDEVAYRSGYGSRWFLTKIKAISPSRAKFTTDRGQVFNKKGASSSASYYACIEPVTDEVRKSVRREKLVEGIQALRYRDFSKVSDEALEKICAAVEGALT